MDDKRLRFEAQALPHLDAAYNLARWLSRSPADADDIVQDAMMRAYRAFDDVKGGEVKPWLLAIVRNCFLTSAARQTKERKIIPLIGDGRDADNSAYVDDKPDPEIALMHADEGRKLSRLISGLPQEFREVVILREMEEERWSRNVDGGRHAVR